MLSTDDALDFLASAPIRKAPALAQHRQAKDRQFTPRSKKRLEKKAEVYEKVETKDGNKAVKQEAAQIFQSIDEDENGQLSAAEICRALSDWGYSDVDIEEFMLTGDTDGDGQLSFEEFLKTAMRLYSDGEYIPRGSLFDIHLAKMLKRRLDYDPEKEEGGKPLIAYQTEFRNKAGKAYENAKQRVLLEGLATSLSVNDSVVRGIASEFRDMVKTGKCVDGKMDFATFEVLWVKHVVLPVHPNANRGQRHEWKDLMAHRAFDAFDVDSDGLLDIREFTRGMCKVCSNSDEERLKLLFDVYDMDDDGELEPAEMQEFLEAAASDEMLAKQLATELIGMLDVNGDGKIKQSEFDRAVMQSKPMRAVFTNAMPKPGTAVRNKLDSIDDLRKHFDATKLALMYSKAESIAKKQDAAGGVLMLDRDDFVQIMSDMGIDNIDISKMVFGCFDQSGDLLVGFSELMNGFAQWLLGDEDDLARFLFQMMDHSGDGNVSLAELQQLIGIQIDDLKLDDATRANINQEAYTLNKAKQMMAKLDSARDGGMRPPDGKVSFDEFRTVLRQDPSVYNTLFPALSGAKKKSAMDERLDMVTSQKVSLKSGSGMTWQPTTGENAGRSVSGKNLGGTGRS